MSEPKLRTPTRRVCECCDRVERWDAARTGWRVETESGEPQVGSPYCIHEWDINGAFVPFEIDANGGTNGDANA